MSVAAKIYMPAK